MGPNEMGNGNKISYGNQRIRDKVLKENKNKNEGFDESRISLHHFDKEYENDANFYDKKSLKEDFLYFHATVEGLKAYILVFKNLIR